METKANDYNEVDILYTLMSYVNVSSYQDMYYTIAQTVLTHLDQIPHISINDLADLCYTSPATISRFCKDLNCKSFANFKREMEIALKIANNEIHFDDDDQDMIENDPQTLVTKIYEDTRESLTRGESNISIKDIDKICELMHESQDVHLVGYQFSKIVGTDFQLKMLKLKKFIYCFVNRGDEIQKLETINEGDLIIILSVRARSELMDSLINKVKEKKPKILMITMNNHYKNPLVDHFYYLSGEESDYTQSSLMGSIAMESLLNVIYVRYGLLYQD